jgi:hypothetical protein
LRLRGATQRGLAAGGSASERIAGNCKLGIENCKLQISEEFLINLQFKSGHDGYMRANTIGDHGVSPEVAVAITFRSS